MKSPEFGILPPIIRYCPHISRDAKLIFGEFTAHANYGGIFIDLKKTAVNLGMSYQKLANGVIELLEAGFIKAWDDSSLPDNFEGLTQIEIIPEAVGLGQD